MPRRVLFLLYRSNDDDLQIWLRAAIDGPKHRGRRSAEGHFLSTADGYVGRPQVELVPVLTCVINSHHLRPPASLSLSQLKVLRLIGK